MGKEIRSVVGKSVTKVMKQDILESSDVLKVCPRRKSRSEAAVHAINSLFQRKETDASNALCPGLATFAINTYRAPVRLFVTGGKELISAEGTTQPLISPLQAVRQAKQCWFADYASGWDHHKTVEWWDELTVVALDLGYYPNAGKCWLVTKPDGEETARSIFEEIVINIITEGRKHLGAALGSRFFLDQDVNGKVE